MSKLPIALIAVVVTSGLAAQTAPHAPTPNERQQTVRSTTEAAAPSTTGAQTARQQSANVQQSKQVARLSKEEKTKLAKDTTKSNLNPENSSGQAATSSMQEQTAAQSKAASRQNTGLSTKQGQQQLEKELRQKSTP